LDQYLAQAGNWFGLVPGPGGELVKTEERDGVGVDGCMSRFAVMANRKEELQQKKMYLLFLCFALLNFR